jgi:hypothetical protein
LAPTSTLSLLPFCFKCFLLASSSSQIEEKKIIKKKNAEKKKSLPLSSCSTSQFWLPLLASCFCPFVSNAFSLESSFFQVEKKKEKHKEKKTIEKKK